MTIGTEALLERIRPFLARFPEDEGTVRELVATDANFNALCHEYCEVIDELGNLEVEVRALKERRTWLEEQLLMRMEGQPPQ